MTNTDRTPAIALYGATGHTGGYILAELRRRGLTPILVGRNAERLRAAADAAGLPEAEIRIADLDDHAALVAAFTGADVVISSLVAFVDLGGAVLAAAIEAGAHYTDTSGEQQFLRRVLDEYGPQAEKAGVTVISGVTDNNLAADLLADLTVPRLDGPVELVVTHRSRSGGNGSKGSAKTVLANLDWFRNGGWHYETGELRTGAAARHRELTFPGDATPTAVHQVPAVGGAHHSAPHRRDLRGGCDRTGVSREPERIHFRRTGSHSRRPRLGSALRRDRRRLRPGRRPRSGRGQRR
ncbi:saccharopine dehydrogenase NADP-binding domain-containing protein [Nocardia tengchongensis]|uniref:Saccharopine dehydrogenase NADP-binding domain-containing protein n=1 Tax=Nocardia tengchongensis TaxID=2055889 RepID=A0ABX8CQN6_9NOCA|nr:saccharopine dehydrogenase NADP-binding domain-containing protein [Nocardia tengchongensis]QVI22222.1 saccharopine dehydrogenase NADP-binding domain-containing protein [Nocardia tengchongensis]